MNRFFYIIAIMALTKAALGNDIFNADNCLWEDASTMANTDVADLSHRLLEVLGKLLLSNSEPNNRLIQFFLKDRGSLDDFQKILSEQLKPFCVQNPKLTPEINIFIKNVINTLRPLMDKKSELNGNDLKGILPALQIFCKRLIDRLIQLQY